ncbi:MAG: hypothetical protein ABFD54_09915 [Armatimonadota bacterium]|nr:hypothetical protein [bacterium]
MKQNRFVLQLTFATIILTLTLALPGPGIAMGIKYKTAGTYVDSAGGQHAWNINDAHALIWDSEPYIPVGGVFVSRCIAQGVNDERFQADVKDLEILKAGGVTDIILKGGRPITDTDPAAWQKIINYLDTNGFTYGVEMDDGPKAPLQGYLISPNRYRLEGPSSETNITCNWPDVDSAIYLVINKADNAIKERGGAVVRDGKVTINLRAPIAYGQVLIVYPHKSFKSVAEGGIGDLWSGFAEYRDRLITFLKAVKFGPGMRFFLEPYTSKMDFTGQMASFVPDSAGFRIGLEAFLTRKYQHEGGLNSGWGMNDNLDSIETATRLIPLWSNGRGMPYAYDKASVGLFGIDATVTQMWRDIGDYRDASAQEYMNTVANVIRKQSVNVPVIFKSTKFHRIYANPFGMGGYDGLGVEAYGTGAGSVTDAAGYVYSLAEESGKSTWFITAATQASPDTGGYGSESDMSATLDLLREVGCKGFFINRLTTDSQQIEWLKNFKDRVQRGSYADYKPAVINYPVSVTTGASVMRIAPDTWWLPTLKTGRTSYIGDGLSAYTITGEDRSYIWSSNGSRSVTLKTGPTGMPSVVFPQDVKTTAKKGGTFNLPLSEVPTVIKGMEFSLVFPYETAQYEMNQLAELIPAVDKAGFDVRKAKDALDRAKTVLQNGQGMSAWDMARTSIIELLKSYGADLWIEGEQSKSENMDNVASMPGASNSLTMLLDTDEAPPLTPYAATYTIDALNNASYEIWLAGTPPAEGSPMSYSVDDVNWTPITAAEGTLQSYAHGLSWYKIGTVNLFPGKHTLQIRCDGKGQSNRYYFAIDALVLSPRGFKPNGVVKPY